MRLPSFKSKFDDVMKRSRYSIHLEVEFHPKSST